LSSTTTLIRRRRTRMRDHRFDLAAENLLIELERHFALAVAAAPDSIRDQPCASRAPVLQ
jgi:hypothetical protein